MSIQQKGAPVKEALIQTALMVAVWSARVKVKLLQLDEGYEPEDALRMYLGTRETLHDARTALWNTEYASRIRALDKKIAKLRSYEYERQDLEMAYEADCIMMRELRSQHMIAASRQD